MGRKASRTGPPRGRAGGAPCRRKTLLRPPQGPPPRPVSSGSPPHSCRSAPAPSPFRVGQAWAVPATNYSSFPRKRESRTQVSSLPLGPRFRGGDQSLLRPSRLVDGEALVGVEDPALDLGGFGRPPPERLPPAPPAH